MPNKISAGEYSVLGFLAVTPKDQLESQIVTDLIQTQRPWVREIAGVLISHRRSENTNFNHSDEDIAKVVRSLFRYAGLRE